MIGTKLGRLTPSKDKVIFYRNKGYSCGGLGNGSGYYILNPADIPKDVYIGTDIKFSPQSVSLPDPQPTSQEIDTSKVYLIRSLLPDNYVVDLNTNSNLLIRSLNPIIQWWWHGHSNQKWRFVRVTDDLYRIQSLYNNQCLSVSTLSGGVNFKDCDGENAKWEIERPLGDSSSYYIRHASTGRVLTASSGLAGTSLSVSSAANSQSQKWHLCEVNQIKLELKDQNGALVTRVFQSGDITNSKNITSIYVAGRDCRSSVGVKSASALEEIGCLPDQAPNPPLLVSPDQGYGNKHEPPTLFWRSGGDPDDSQLDYQVEISNASQTTYSGWIQDTSWKPNELSGSYGTYAWRVQARDPELVVSAWSQTRSFSILSPNGLPEIDFQTANTSSGEKIFTRETIWTFAGVASDPEGQLTRLEFRCSGDNCGTQTIHTGLTNWSHTQTNLSGQNEIYFVAYDDYVVNNLSGQSAASRKITLLIDLAAPVTTPALNGQSNAAQWPEWFTGPVQINLRAADKGTGLALAGMGKIHYRLDGGAWQIVSGSDTSFTVHVDGSHTVEYFGEDVLGNTEATRSFGFQVDQTPPSLPVDLQESHGLISDQWQKDQNIPAFTWNAATDATSGVRGYQFYFGDDPNGIGYRNILASEALQWTPFPAGLPTGTSYLRARTQDNAGNWSAWTTLFTFRYDGTPPENPEDVVHAAGITTAWQNASRAADFSWATAHDEGSGVRGYHVYWGNDPNAVSDAFITIDAFQDPTTLCSVNSACTSYLRLRSEDHVGNLAEDWNTVFILRYDNALPTLDFSFNGGAAETAQTQITVNVMASDEGSGVYATRFSADGQKWTDWEVPAAGRLWNIPPISRQSWPVYVQVKDHVGLLSSIVQHDVYLDVNQSRPSSFNYQIFDQSLSGGSESYSSDHYSGHGTVSQVIDAPSASSVNYILWNGYEAGSQSVPLIVPGHEEYTFLGGIVASGSVTNSLESADYRMMISMGDIGLSATTTIDSGNYQHQPGFLAGIPIHHPAPPGIDPSTIEQLEMPVPAVETTPICDAPSISINNGAVYTDTPRVTLNLCAPYASEMMISSYEDFAGSNWEPFVSTRSWTLSIVGSTLEPHFVYAQFKDIDGKIYATYFDDVLYDPNQPNGSLLMDDDILVPASDPLDASQVNALTGDTELAIPQPDADGSVTLYVDGYDDNSGLTEMQLSADPTFKTAVWQPFAPIVDYVPEGMDGPKTVYAQFRDEAGNLSGSVATEFIYDTQPPDGYIYAEPAVLPMDATTTTLYLGSYSYLDEYCEETPPDSDFDGEAVEMRLGADPGLTGAYWEPLADSVTVPIDPTQPEGTFYVQYRDAAGNLSEIYNATYYVDTFSPDLSAAAEPGDGNTRIVNIYAEDNLSGVANLSLSNDPLMKQEVVTSPYIEALNWTFDDRKVVWIVAEDGVGNLTQPYPVYASDTPMTPANGEIVLHRRPIFNWPDTSGASSYRIVASQSKTFSTALWTVNTITSTYTPPADLPAGKVIYWRMRAKVGTNWGAWSETWSFTTPKSPSIPVLISPANKAITKDYTPLLRWKVPTIPSGGAAFDHYQVQLSTDKTFPEPLLINAVTPSGNISASSFTSDTDLTPNHRYYWRVRAFNAAGQYSSWSTVWSFATALLPPSNPTPTGGEAVPSRKPLLDWDVVEGASGYSIQISTSNNFSTLLVNTTVRTDMFTPGTNLPANRILFWRVRAIGTNGPSNWTMASLHTP